MQENVVVSVKKPVTRKNSNQKHIFVYGRTDDKIPIQLPTIAGSTSARYRRRSDISSTEKSYTCGFWRVRCHLVVLNSTFKIVIQCLYFRIMHFWASRIGNAAHVNFAN